MKKPTLKKLQNKADRLWRTVGKEDATCEVCDTREKKVNYKQLHSHHVIGRRNKTLRWRKENRVWLCASCHTLGILSSHENPIWFLKWFMKHRRKDYKFISKNQMKISKFTIKDMEEIIEGLE